MKYHLRQKGFFFFFGGAGLVATWCILTAGVVEARQIALF